MMLDDDDANHAMLPLPSPTTTLPGPLPPTSCCWTMTETTWPSLPSCWEPPLLTRMMTALCLLTTCFLSLPLEPNGGAAGDVLYAAGGAEPGPDAAAETCRVLLALGWAIVGVTALAALQTTGADDILGPPPSVGVSATVAESRLAHLALLAPGRSSLDDPPASGGRQEDLHAVGGGPEAILAEDGCGPVRGQEAVNEEAGEDQQALADGRGHAERDAGDQGAVHPAVQGGQEMSLATLGSGQAEHDGADGCGHKYLQAGGEDQGAIQTAVRGGQRIFPAELGSGQADLHADGDKGQENHLAGAGGDMKNPKQLKQVADMLTSWQQEADMMDKMTSKWQEVDKMTSNLAEVN